MGISPLFEDKLDYIDSSVFRGNIKRGLLFITVSIENVIFIIRIEAIRGRSLLQTFSELLNCVRRALRYDFVHFVHLPYFSKGV